MIYKHLKLLKGMIPINKGKYRILLRVLRDFEKGMFKKGKFSIDRAKAKKKCIFSR